MRGHEIWPQFVEPSGPIIQARAQTRCGKAKAPVDDRRLCVLARKCGTQQGSRSLNTHLRRLPKQSSPSELVSRVPVAMASFAIRCLTGSWAA